MLSRAREQVEMGIAVEEEIARLRQQIAKLERINASLMGRVERSTDLQGNAFSIFETAITLESKVRERTSDLERALDELAGSNAALAHARDTADAARRRLSDAIEAVDEGFAIFDADDRLVLCNQTYLSLWPKIADRIVPGMRFEEILAEVSGSGAILNERLAPDRWLSERMALHSHAAGGQVLALADGRWVQVNERRTSDGGIVGIYTDITDIKAEDARQRAVELAERAMVLQGTLDAMPQGVCLFDRDQTLLAWNDPLLTLLGLNPADAKQHIADHAALVEHCRSALPRADAANTLGWIDAGEIVAVRRIADGRSIEIRRLAVRGGGMVMSFDDVTERLRSAAALERRVAQRTAELRQQVAEREAAESAMREAKTAAEQANLSKTRFLAAASHDVLQPLNAARLFVSALAARRVSASNRVLIDQTASALDSVESLLEALLEISKLDAGAITPELSDIPLAELFETLRGEFAVLAEEQGLSLVVRTTDLWVRSDRRLLRRVLQNFLSNALRYTTAGSVTMEARRREDGVVVAVSDTGSGIDAAHHEEIFEEFRRLDGRTRGIGLGLAIVQRASRMLGHPIGVESAVGKGSTFSITAPLVAGPRSAAGARVPRAGGIGVRHVLVVDNEVPILEGMKAMLGGWGMRVRTADTIEGARAASRRGGAIEMILADYHLADGEYGDDAVSTIRRELGRDVPAVIITADRTPALRERLEGAGLHVLQKPVKPAQLRALLARLS